MIECLSLSKRLYRYVNAYWTSYRSQRVYERSCESCRVLRSYCVVLNERVKLERKTKMGKSIVIPDSLPWAFLQARIWYLGCRLKWNWLDLKFASTFWHKIQKCVFADIIHYSNAFLWNFWRIEMGWCLSRYASMEIFVPGILLRGCFEKWNNNVQIFPNSGSYGSSRVDTSHYMKIESYIIPNVIHSGLHENSVVV